MPTVVKTNRSRTSFGSSRSSTSSASRRSSIGLSKASNSSIQSKSKNIRSYFTSTKTTETQFVGDGKQSVTNKKNIDFESIESLLASVFKHKTFRSELQHNAIKEACQFRRDLFVSFPTGSGKSLIYQLPALFHNNGLAIVVSPLVALISNQITNARRLGIPSATINSHMLKSTNDQIKSEIVKKRVNLRLLYLTPETLCSDNFKGYLNTMSKNKTLKLFAIDEAHCVSSWGHEFRHDYLKLSKLREDFPHIPIIALTATATKKVLDDIIQILNLNDPKRFVASPFRENLYYDVIFADKMKPIDLLKQLVEFIKVCLKIETKSEQRTSKQQNRPKFISGQEALANSLKKSQSDNLDRSFSPQATNIGGGFVSAASLLGSAVSKQTTDKKQEHHFFSRGKKYGVGVDHLTKSNDDCSLITANKSNGVAIVYCRTKAYCEEVAEFLNANDLPSRPYHSSLTPKQRTEIENLWMNEEILIICATISFGMGIDKANVRAVVHFNMAQSLANYYQESGRAGRDGLKAKCRLYYSLSDQNAISFLLRKDGVFDEEGDLSEEALERFGAEVCKRKQTTARNAMIRFERMVEYCRSFNRCRHQLLAKEFALDSYDVTTNCGSAGSEPSKSIPPNDSFMVNGCGSSCDYCTGQCKPPQATSSSYHSA